MNVTFVGANPREKARPILDQVLANGADQILIASAFLRGAGVELLKPHAARLLRPQSSVVIAWIDEPKQQEAFKELHAVCPGHVFAHLGDQLPVEKGVGPGIMHSKLFFARNRQRCWLWTGSHNLTALATLGGNCEAAVLLEGNIDEQPFQHAMKHLERCKTEAILYNPASPPPSATKAETLVIHVEAHVRLKNPPWFVHVRQPSSDYDRAMQPPTPVWLFVYPSGSLRKGQRRTTPALKAFSGTLTAINFTEHHAQRGISANWPSADFVIEQTNGVFQLISPRPNATTPTQGMLRILKEEDPSVAWVSDAPVPRLERVAGEPEEIDVEPEYRRFFTARSIRGTHLVRRPYVDLRLAYRVPEKEIGELEADQLSDRIPAMRDALIQVEQTPVEDDKFEFIYRAKYRINPSDD